MSGTRTATRDEIVTVLCQLLEQGIPVSLACQRARISVAAYHRWKKLAREGNPDYEEIIGRLAQAEAKAGVGWMERLVNAADEGDTRALTWLLSHRFPKQFGDQAVVEQVEVEEPPDEDSEQAQLERSYTAPERLLTLLRIDLELGLLPKPAPLTEEQLADPDSLDPVTLAVYQGYQAAFHQERQRYGEVEIAEPAPVLHKNLAVRLCILAYLHGRDEVTSEVAIGAVLDMTPAERDVVEENARTLINEGWIVETQHLANGTPNVTTWSLASSSSIEPHDEVQDEELPPPPAPTLASSNEGIGNYHARQDKRRSRGWRW
jgi:hypothetical protein